MSTHLPSIKHIINNDNDVTESTNYQTINATNQLTTNTNINKFTAINSMNTEDVNKEGKYAQTIFDYELSPNTSPSKKLERLHLNNNRRMK